VWEEVEDSGSMGKQESWSTKKQATKRIRGLKTLTMLIYSHFLFL
jgi:hypothetical protein